MAYEEERMSNEELVHVLDGYKVLDFTQVLAGPTVTRLMAEMGAEIIKVELAPKGDFSRAMPFLKDDRSAYFIFECWKTKVSSDGRSEDTTHQQSNACCLSSLSPEPEPQGYSGCRPVPRHPADSW